MLKCPQNHDSESADFCSVCGAEIAARDASNGGAAPSRAATAVGTEPGEPLGLPCPDCRTPRESPGQVYCGVCGRNFETGSSGIPPIAPGPAPAPSTVPGTKADSDASSAARSVRGVRWKVTVQADPSLYGAIDPNAPGGQPAQVFDILETESLIGRLTPGIRARVPIYNDPGISRRHALLLREPDGGLSIRDLGSANGTQLNGTDLVAGVATPLNDGDSIALGAWTRVTVTAVRPAGPVTP